MSEAEQPSAALPLATIEAIARAANARAALSPETMEAVRGWLSDALAGAVRRAGARPLTKDDVDRLQAAYDKFRQAIADLQDRDDPPPQLPSSDGGWTAWDQWLIGQRQFPLRQGRLDSTDWRLIAALLALYETVSGKNASGTQENGPTMRFLKAAQVTLVDCGHAFAIPKHDALKTQIRELRHCYLPLEKRALAEIISVKRD